MAARDTMLTVVLRPLSRPHAALLALTIGTTVSLLGDAPKVVWLVAGVGAAYSLAPSP